MIHVSDMHEFVMGTLNDWLPGYTYPPDNSKQYKIGTTDIDNVYIVIDPEELELPKWFEVTVTVREINQVGDGK